MKQELTDMQSAFLTNMVETYGDMLYHYCAKCVNYNQKLMPFIPDLVQEVYLKASANVDTLMHHNNIPGWLKKSCHFSLLNMLRNQKNSREILYPTIEKLQSSLNNDHIWARNGDPSITLKEVLDAAETILTEEEQAIFNDYFLDDLSTLESAQLNHMSYDTVRGKISRIRKKLKVHFSLSIK